MFPCVKKIQGVQNEVNLKLRTCTSLREYKAKIYTVCSKSLDPFYIVTYYIKWVKTSWTYSMTKKISWKN